MLSTARERGVYCSVQYNYRFTNESQYVRRCVDRGELGEIYFAHTEYIRRVGIPGLGTWFTRKKLSGGGALIDCGVHMMDLALWFMGYPRYEKISANIGSAFGRKGEGKMDIWYRPSSDSSTRFDVEDYAFAHVGLRGGAGMVVETSWAGFVREEKWDLRLWGTKGGVRFFPLEIYKKERDAQINLEPALESRNEYAASVADFVQTVRSGDWKLTTAEQGVQLLELIEEIYRSGGVQE